jgi:hypothetical protein
MKSHGNAIVNKTFNPKNVRPDIPLDADEVDSAMERFIRKKYQERSLSSGKPRLPSRGADSGLTDSMDESPPPPLPPKKGKLFGFGLRASSAAYPSSKADRKKLPIEPTFEGAYGMASTDFEGSKDDNHSQRAIEFHAALDNEDMSEKLHVLREMGFRDEQQNTYVLKRLNNRLELAVEYLIKHGKKKPSGGTVVSAEPIRKGSATFPEVANGPATQGPQTESNPFERRAVSDQVGLSFSTSQQPPQVQVSNSGTLGSSGAILSNNPFESQPVQAPTVASLEQSFQGMQIARPLFPNSTGGYPVQSQPQFDSRLQHSMTPPVPLIPQQYGFVASPPAMNVASNPFFQDPQSSQSSFSNPYASAMQTPSSFASSNPFFTQMASSGNIQQPLQQPQSSMNLQNPFGIPPSEPQAQQQQFQQQTNLPSQQTIFDQNQQTFYVNANALQTLNLPTPGQQLQSQVQSQVQSQGQLGYSNPFGNFQNTQAQFPQPTQPQVQSQQLQPPQLSQFQPQAQQPSQPQYNYQNHAQQPIYPQQTGRIDKTSILALYNYPHLAPQRPSLPSIGETTDAQSGTSSPAPSNDLYAGFGTTSAKRSVTMPAPSTSSSALTGSRNPFLKAGGSGSGSPNIGVNGGMRHVSNESVAIANSDSGRHSPDAFANLSARYA